MALQTREIKGRLQSIKNTKKITHTMELVSAAKMRKAIASANDAKPYAKMAWDIMERIQRTEIVSKEDPIQKFFKKPSGNKTLLILYTANRGLCGSMNSHIVRTTLNYMNQYPDQEYTLVSIGKKGSAQLVSFGYDVKLVYEKDESAFTDESIMEVAGYAYDAFMDGEVNRVVIVYTSYTSPVVQSATLKQIYPIVEPDKEGGSEDYLLPYIYEPNPKSVLAYILPRIAEVELYFSLLQSNASEHSARMIAMKNATDAAGEMAEDLTLLFNRARQASITQEIAEISAGSAAVS